jgi:hypothetical protein
LLIVRVSLAVALSCALLASACTLDFGKYAPGGDGGATGQDAATVGDGTAPADAGNDVTVPADTGADVALDVGTDSTEPPEASMPDASEASVVDYTVGGSISGLIGMGMQLANGGNTLTLASGATQFTFPAQPDGSAYAVTVMTPPAMPSQACTVMNGSGNVAGAKVGNVMLVCTPSCAPACADGKMCVDGTDCASKVCTSGTCAAPACAPSCGPGSPCGTGSDCKSGQCKGNHTCK